MAAAQLDSLCGPACAAAGCELARGSVGGRRRCRLVVGLAGYCGTGGYGGWCQGVQGQCTTRVVVVACSSEHSGCGRLGGSACVMLMVW